jgi:hypothetical protein
LRLAPVLTIALAGAIPAQSLTVDAFARGATARLDYAGGAPGGVAALVLGFAGAGVGFPLDSDAVFDLFDPILIWSFALVPPDGTVPFTVPLPTDFTTPQLSAQVIEITFAEPWDWRSSNALTEVIAPLTSLSDDFAAGILGGAWSVMHPGLGGASVQGGELVLAPVAGGLPDMWFEDGEGLAVVRTVTGDFEVSCEVLVHAAADQASPPAVGYRLGGLLIRDSSAAATNPGAHEWCHVATGSGGIGQPMGVEWKQTHASSSSWGITPVASTHRELRLVRSGNGVTAWHRDVGAATWIQLASYSFASLPATVEVGAMCYANEAPAEVVARFARIDFAD